MRAPRRLVRTLSGGLRQRDAGTVRLGMTRRRFNVRSLTQRKKSGPQSTQRRQVSGAFRMQAYSAAAGRSPRAGCLRGLRCKHFHALRGISLALMALVVGIRDAGAGPPAVVGAVAESTYPFHCFLTTGAVRDRSSRFGNADEDSPGAWVWRPLGLKSPATRQRDKSLRNCPAGRAARLPVAPGIAEARPATGGLERVKGIEPSCAAWEAAVLPLNYTRAGQSF